MWSPRRQGSIANPHAGCRPHPHHPSGRTAVHPTARIDNRHRISPPPCLRRIARTVRRRKAGPRPGLRQRPRFRLARPRAQVVRATPHRTMVKIGQSRGARRPMATARATAIVEMRTATAAVRTTTLAEMRTMKTAERIAIREDEDNDPGGGFTGNLAAGDDVKRGDRDDDTAAVVTTGAPEMGTTTAMR